MPNIKSLVVMSTLLSNAKGYSDPGSKNTSRLRNPKFSTISKTQIIQTLASNHSYASHTSHTRKLDESGSTDALPLVYTKIDSRCDNDCKTILTADSGLLVAFDIYDGNFGFADVVLML
jgi:hypothetical protein